MHDETSWLKASLSLQWYGSSTFSRSLFASRSVATSGVIVVWSVVSPTPRCSRTGRDGEGGGAADCPARVDFRDVGRPGGEESKHGSCGRRRPGLPPYPVPCTLPSPVLTVLPCHQQGPGQEENASASHLGFFDSCPHLLDYKLQHAGDTHIHTNEDEKECQVDNLQRARAGSVPLL